MSSNNEESPAPPQSPESPLSPTPPSPRSPRDSGIEKNNFNNITDDNNNHHSNNGNSNNNNDEETKNSPPYSIPSSRFLTPPFAGIPYTHPQYRQIQHQMQLQQMLMSHHGPYPSHPSHAHSYHPYASPYPPPSLYPHSYHHSYLGHYPPESGIGPSNPPGEPMPYPGSEAEYLEWCAQVAGAMQGSTQGMYEFGDSHQQGQMMFAPGSHPMQMPLLPPFLHNSSDSFYQPPALFPPSQSGKLSDGRNSTSPTTSSSSSSSSSSTSSTSTTSSSTTSNPNSGSSIFPSRLDNSGTSKDMIPVVHNATIPEFVYIPHGAPPSTLVFERLWQLSEPMHRNYYQSLTFQLPSPSPALQVPPDPADGSGDLVIPNFEGYRVYVHPDLGYSGNAKRFKQAPEQGEKALVLEGTVYDKNMLAMKQCQACMEYFDHKSYFTANPHCKGRLLLIKNNLITRIGPDLKFSLQLKPMCCCSHQSQSPFYFYFTLSEFISSSSSNVLMTTLFAAHVKQWKKALNSRSAIHASSTTSSATTNTDQSENLSPNQD